MSAPALRFILASLFLFFCQWSDAVAQADTTVVLADTVAPKSKVRMSFGQPHRPKRAVWMSAALPGLGQVYNKRWWKLPIIYGGFAGLVYGIVSSDMQRTEYRDAYLKRVDNDPATVDPYETRYSDANMKELISYYQRNRDLCIIFTVALYGLNIIDATVDGHLFSFDVSEDLSMSARPMLMQPLNAATPLGGVGIVFTLR
jgi:hypothetical protein